MQILSDPEYSRSGPEWWVYDLLVLFSLFIVEIYASIKSLRVVWMEIPRELYTNALPGNALPENIVETTPLTSSGLETPLRRFKIHDEGWSSRTTQIYIVLVLYVAVTGFISLSLPKPLFFGFIQWGMPFVAAYFLARSWRREEH